MSLISGCASVDSDTQQTPRARRQDRIGQEQPMTQGDVETLAEELFQSGVAVDRAEAREMARANYWPRETPQPLTLPNRAPNAPRPAGKK